MIIADCIIEFLNTNLETEFGFDCYHLTNSSYLYAVGCFDYFCVTPNSVRVIENIDDHRIEISLSDPELFNKILENAKSRIGITKC